jgi:ankyrin repeat protein
MNNSSVVRTSVSIQLDLWNSIQIAMKEDNIDTFSQWVSNSSRLNLKTRKARNIRELLSCLSNDEIELLKSELSI